MPKASNEMQVDVARTKARPPVRLRLTVDSEMGPFYEWCVGMGDRVRAREVLVAARCWYDRHAASAPEQLSPRSAMLAQSPPQVVQPQADGPRDQSAAAAGLGARFLRARPSLEDGS